MKSNQEENEKIKAPLRDYNEIDINKPKYKNNRPREDRPREERPKEEKIYFTKPQFKSSTTKENGNFVELEKDKDVKLLIIYLIL